MPIPHVLSDYNSGFSPIQRRLLDENFAVCTPNNDPLNPATTRVTERPPLATDDVSKGYIASQPSTTLSGGINSAVLALTVSSAGTFPRSGSFYILIGTEVLLVSANKTVWAVQGNRGALGSTAASHSDGDVIVMLPGPLLAAGIDSSQTTLTVVNGSSLPTTGSSIGQLDSEIVLLTFSAAGITIARAQLSSTAASHSGGTQLIMGNFNPNMGSVWQYRGQVWQCIDATVGAAVWQVVLPRPGALPGDVLGSNTKIAAGVAQLVAGFTGAALDVMVVTGGNQQAPTAVSILADGAFDTASLAKLLATADAGTYARVAKAYAQDGNGNHLLAGGIKTTLNGAINNSVTALAIASASGFPISGNSYIRIGSEIMLVTVGGGSTSYSGITRGALGTSAASHLDGDTVYSVFSGPKIGLRAHDGIPEMSWEHDDICGLVIPSTLAFGTRALSAFLFGHVISCAGHAQAVIDFGNTNSGQQGFAVLEFDAANSPLAGCWSIFGVSVGATTALPLLAESGAQALSLICSASGVVLGSNEAQVTGAAFSNLTMPGGGNIGCWSRGSYSGSMSLFGIVIANAAATTAQQAAVRQAAYANYNIQPQAVDQIIAIGDSLVEGYGTLAGLNWGSQLASRLKSVRPMRVINQGTGGQTAANIAAYYAPLAASKYQPGARNIAILLEGGNDLNLGDSAATVFANLKLAAQTLRSAGFRVAVLNYPTWSVGPTNITAYRSLVGAMSPSDGADLVLDVMSIPQMSDASNLTYRPDGIHFTAAMHGLVAEWLAMQIAPLL